MGVEIGAKFGLLRGGREDPGVPEGRRAAGGPIRARPDAVYRSVYQVDLSTMEPQVALPHTVDNVNRGPGGRDPFIDQCFIGSCTNARLEDLEAAAGCSKRRIHPDSADRQPGLDRGVPAAMHGVFRHFPRPPGPLFPNPTCGACQGVHTGLLAPRKVHRLGQPRISKGRMEPRVGSIPGLAGDGGGLRHWRKDCRSARA